MNTLLSSLEERAEKVRWQLTVFGVKGTRTLSKKAYYEAWISTKEDSFDWSLDFHFRAPVPGMDTTTWAKKKLKEGSTMTLDEAKAQVREAWAVALGS